MWFLTVERRIDDYVSGGKLKKKSRFARSIDLWVTAVLGFPGLFLYGFCVFVVATASSCTTAERGTNQEWVRPCSGLVFAIYSYSQCLYGVFAWDLAQGRIQGITIGHQKALFHRESLSPSN